MLILSQLSGLLSAIIIFLIFVFLIFEMLPLLMRVDLLQFVNSNWSPSNGSYGLWPMVAGSIWVVVGAVAIAAPLGIAVAIFNVWYAPYIISSILQVVLALLAGIPSVVFGLWGLQVLVPKINIVQPPGLSVLAGIFILAIMILPTAALLSDATLRSLPKSYMQGAMALGIGRWAAIRHILLPAASTNLIGAIVLQVGRAIGETMAVLMVMGNALQIPTDIFDPARTLTSHMALEMAYASGDHRRALFLTGFLILLIVTTLVLFSVWLGRRQNYENR